jgi:hypothetical protein
MKIQPHKIGVLVGTLIGGLHVCWSLLVHMLSPGD